MGEEKVIECEVNKSEDPDIYEPCGRPVHKRTGRCIFHTEINNKTGAQGKFWDDFWEEYEKTRTAYKEAEVNGEKHQIFMDCRRFIFPPIADRFRGQVFGIPVNFGRAKFESGANFAGTHFVRNVSFKASEFKGIARFSGAVFLREADFSGVIFGGETYFDETVFNNDTTFSFSEFHGVTYFVRTRRNEKKVRKYPRGHR